VEEPALATDAPGPSSAPVGEGQRVLVAEDNLEVGRFCTQIVEDLGDRTTGALTSRRHWNDWDRMATGSTSVSGVVMPGTGGVALAGELCQRLPGLPVVLASGYSHILAQEGGHDYGLLHKPHSAEQPSRVLQRVLAGQQRCPTG